MLISPLVVIISVLPTKILVNLCMGPWVKALLMSRFMLIAKLMVQVALLVI